MLTVLSLDSAAPSVLDRMIERGELPAIDALLRAGTTTQLTEELPGAVYASLYTGRRLAEHGVYFPLQWSSRRQRVVSTSNFLARELDRHSVFRRLASAGRTSLVIDPSECPPHGVEGSRLISGLQFRSRILLPQWSTPRSVARSLQQSRPPFLEETFGRPSPRFLTRLGRELARAPGRVAAAAERLTAEQMPDLLWVNFAAVHLAGHQLWDLSFLHGVPMSASEQRFLEDALGQVYRAADEAVGRIVALLPPGATILLLSPKAMGPNCARSDMLPGMVNRILEGGRPGSRRRGIWELRASLPTGTRAAIARLLPSEAALRLTAWLHDRGMRPGVSRAMVPPCDGEGFVRFNVAGRERDGCVPAATLEELCAEVIDGLSTFEDMGGGPSVAQISTAEEYAGRGPRLEELPDLIVDWTPGSVARLRGVSSPRFGDVERLGVGAGRSGNHCSGGTVTVISGKGSSASAREPECRVEDVPATVCAVLGVSAEGMAGSPLPEIVS